MKKIVMLDTSISSINQGDEIINLSIKKNWPELFQKNYIFTLASHSTMFGWFQTTFFKKKFRVIDDADYKFLCGTNALYKNMLRPKPNWNINPANVKLVKNTICIGVGMGNNSNHVNFYTRWLLDKALSHDFIHSTRDEKTKDFLEQLGFKAVNTGCPTMWGLMPDKLTAIPQKKAESVVFTLTYYGPDRDNDLAMIEILKQNYQKVYFWPQCIRDLEYLQSLSDLKGIEIVAPNLESYDAILNTGVDYVGNRLHGGIFALQHACRAIIIAIDHRAIDINADYSFPCIERKHIPLKLNDMINDSWETKIKGLDFEKIDLWKKQFHFD